MEEAARWVYAICVGAMICGIVSVLSPAKVLAGPLRMLLGLFLLLCFLLPASVSWEIPDIQWQEAELQREQAAQRAGEPFRQRLEEEGERQLEEEIGQVIARMGAEEREYTVYLELESDEAGEPSLRVRLTLPQRLMQQHLEIQEQLEKQLDFPLVIQYKEEEA